MGAKISFMGVGMCGMQQGLFTLSNLIIKKWGVGEWGGGMFQQHKLLTTPELVKPIH